MKLFLKTMILKAWSLLLLRDARIDLWVCFYHERSNLPVECVLPRRLKAGRGGPEGAPANAEPGAVQAAEGPAQPPGRGKHTRRGDLPTK